MRLTKNKFCVFLINAFCALFFSIPILLEKIFRPSFTLTPKKILILEIWGIGDLVMMSPILRLLRESFKDAEIVLLSKKEGQVLFGGTDRIDRFITFHFPWTRFSNKYHLWQWPWRSLLSLVLQLRRKRFSLILDARGDIRNNLLSFLIGGKRRIGYTDTGGAYFLTDALAPSQERKHRTDRWMQIATLLNIPTQAHPSTYVSVKNRDSKFVDTYLRKQGIGSSDFVIGIHPGAAVEVRRWPLERFIELANELWRTLSVRVIMLADPNGYGSDPAFEQGIIQFQGSLGCLIALIERLNLLICNDSGPMHIATALKVPVLAVFGPGDPKLVGPVGENTKIVIQEPMPCRPCFDHCKYPEPYCLTRLTIQTVLDGAKQILAEHRIPIKVMT